MAAIKRKPRAKAGAAGGRKQGAKRRTPPAPARLSRKAPPPDGGVFRHIFEQAAVGIAHVDLDNRYFQANQRFCEITGYRQEELIGMAATDLSHPDEIGKGREQREHLISGALRSFSQEKRYVRKDGTVIWVNRTECLARDEAGRPLYFIRIVEDVTRRKQLEQQFQATFEQAAVGIAHTTTEGGFLLVNGKLCEILGYTAAELLALTTRDLTHPDDRGWQDTLRLDLLAGRRSSFTGDKRYLRKDGSAVWISRTVTLARHTATGEPYLIQVIEDISERKRTEARLDRLTRARCVTAECNHTLIHATDEADMLSSMCRIVVDSGGYRMAWVGLTTGDSVRPVYPAAHAGFGDDAPMTGPGGWSTDGRYQGFMHHVIATGEPHIARDILNNPEFEYRRSRAVQHGFQSSIALPLKSEDAILGALAIYAREADAFDGEEIALLNELAGDISYGLSTLRMRIARQQAEEQAQDSARRLHETVEQAAVGITRVDLEGVLIDVNQKFCDMLGYTRSELSGKSIRDITHPDDYGRGARFRVGVARGDMKSAGGEKRFVRKDGTVIWARRTMSVAHDSAGNPQYVISVVEDITERKEIERRFELAFNQAAVGMVQSSLDNRYIQVNQKFADMLGYSREELAGMAHVSVTHPDDYAEIRQQKEKLLRGEIDSTTDERRLIRKDGSEVWAYRTISTVRSITGEPLHFIGVFEDITEHKQLEARMEQTFEQAAVGIVRTDFERNILAVNRKFCEIVGYGRGELLKMNLQQISHPDDLGMNAGDRARLRAGEIEHFSREKRYVCKGGRIIWAKRTVSLVRDISGRPEHFIFVIEDVTERRAAEERYRTTFDYAPVGIVHTTIDGRILRVNPKLCEILGYAREELLGTEHRKLVRPDRLNTDRPRFLRQMLEGNMPSFSSERPYLRKDGTVVWVNRTVSLVRDAAGNPDYLLRVIEDISERKQAEEAADRERTLLRAIVDTLPDHIYVKDRAGRYQLVNEAGLRIRGMTHDRIVGRTAFDVLPREVAEKFDAEDRSIMEAAVPLVNREMATADPAAGVRWHLTTKVPMRDGSGEVIGIVGVNHDITDRKRAEEALKVSEETFRATFDQANVGITMTSLDLRYLRVNDKYCDIIGYTRDELLGMTMLDVNPPETTVEAVESREKLAADGSGVSYYREKQLRRKDGSLVWVALTSSLIRGHDGEPKHFISVIQDISERKQAEARVTRLNWLYSALSQTNETIVRTRDRDTLFREVCRIAVEHGQLKMAWIGLLDTETGWIEPRVYAGGGGRYLEGLRISADGTLPEGRGPGGVALREDRIVVSNDVRDDLLFAPWSERARAEGFRSVASVPLKFGGRVIGLLALMAGEVNFFDEELTRLLNEMAQDISFALDNFELEARHQQTLLALRESDEKFQQLAGNIPQVFWISDVVHRQTLYISPAVEQLTGRSQKEVMASRKALIGCVHKDDRARVRAARKSAGRGGYDETYRVSKPDGTIRWVRDRAFPVRDAHGALYRIAGIAEDITEKKEAEERLLYLAHYDGLTSLPNRVLFYDRLRQALAQARRNNWITAVMFLDLDRFKNVNDTLGHGAGDLLLKHVSERLAGCVRSGDTVGRLGGDEFAIVLSNLGDTGNASLVTQKIMAALAEPFRLDGAEIYISASIGITLYPTDSLDQDTLIRNADTAMYRAKELGRNGCQFYAPEMNARALEKLSLESSLRRALERDEFLLHYQPKVSLHNGEITGVEALMRWQHPERGLVSPAEFMPVLEETGLIMQAGEWAIRAACMQIGAWKRAGTRPVPVAVNLSARQFQAKDLGAAIRRIVEEQGMDPGLLELEITESSLVNNTEEAIRTLTALSDFGIRIAIDDFGTGYSSLSYLKRFPLDALKIDSSFVRDVITDTDDAAITRAIITMAHNLELAVIAEGVETEPQLNFLSVNGCDQIQGYYFSRPLPAEECEGLLRSDRRLRLRAGGEAEPAGVLLVDDDEDALLLLRRQLSADGYRVYVAPGAREGLELLGQHDIRVVVSDYSMPGMSGVEFLQRVKSLYPDTLRIMLSGHADFHTVTEAVNRSEVYRFVSKDRDSDRLRSDIREGLASLQRGRPRRAG